MSNEDCIFRTPAAGVEPRIDVRGPVQELDGFYVVSLRATGVPAGWEVRVGAPLGPWSTLPANGLVTLGSLGGRPPSSLVAYLYNPATGGNSVPATITLSVPDSPPELVGPSIATALPDISVLTGGAATADLSGGFANAADAAWSITVAGAAPPAGWSISAAGLLTYPVASAYAPTSVTVTVTKSGLSASQTFSVTVTAAPSGALRVITQGVFQDTGEGTATGPNPGALWRVTAAVWDGGTAPFTTEYRVLRNGSVIRDWAATSVRYAIVEADRGATLTAQHRRTDSASPTPASVTYTPAGSAVVPSGVVVGTLVSTLADLNTAIANSVAGQTIRVAPGSYGSPSISGVVKAGGQVRIVAAETANPPRFANPSTADVFDINLSGAAGFILDNLLIGPAVDPAAGARTLNSGNINYSNARRITIRNCRMQNRNNGLSSGGGSEDVTVEACEITKYEMDAIRLYNGNVRFTYRNNRSFGCVPHPTRNDHRDCFQIATTQNNAWVEDVLIENNHMTGIGTAMHQGILIRNGWILGAGANPPNGAPPTAPTWVWPAQGHQRITIRGNLIEIRNTSGLGVSCTKDVLYERNTLRRLAGSYLADSNNSSQPRVCVYGPSTGRVRNNVQAHSSIFYQTEFHEPSGTPATGTAGMFTELSFTQSASAFPTGWVDPVVGPGSLGW